MNRKICESELFATAVIMLYGSFTATKYALAAGDLAIVAVLASAASELAAILIISYLPPINTKKSLLSVFCSFVPIVLCVYALSGGANELASSDFKSISSSVIIIASVLFVCYTASKGLGVIGRVGIIAVICVALVLPVLLVAFCKDFDFSRLICGYRDSSFFARIMLSPISEVFTLYLMKGYFYVSAKGRIAKAPKAEQLCEKELFGRYRKCLLSAWAVSSAASVSVSVFCLALAPSSVYAAFGHPATYACRLLHGLNISPLISICIFMITLFRCSASLCASSSVISDVLMNLYTKKK